MSYLAHVSNFKIGVAWRGLRSLLTEGELFWLKLQGEGIVFVNSYGAIEKLKLSAGEKATIDNFHSVAIDPTVKWNVKTFGGVKSTLLGGEGLVVEMEGLGRVWVQTRILPAFVELIARFLSKEK